VCPEADDTGPCRACPRQVLDSYLEHGYGQLIRNVLDIDFALQIRMEVPMERVNYFEFLLLKILNEERNRYQDEQMKKPHG